MAEQETILTEEGLKKLEDELDYLRSEKRQQVAERLKVAISYGDISENSEYDDAKNEQAFVEGRILTLEKMIRNAKVIKDSGNTNYADTVLCGFDGNQSAIEAVMDGSLTIDIAQMGYDMGYKAVEAAVTVLEGGSVESFIDSGSKVIDSSNIDEYVSDMKSKGLWE